MMLDLIAQAKAGTGKTCVFTVITLDALRPDLKAPQVGNFDFVRFDFEVGPDLGTNSGNCCPNH